MNFIAYNHFQKHKVLAIAPTASIDKTLGLDEKRVSLWTKLSHIFCCFSAKSKLDINNALARTVISFEASSDSTDCSLPLFDDWVRSYKPPHVIENLRQLLFSEPIDFSILVTRLQTFSDLETPTTELEIEALYTAVLGPLLSQCKCDDWLRPAHAYVLRENGTKVSVDMPLFVHGFRSEEKSLYFDSFMERLKKSMREGSEFFYESGFQNIFPEHASFSNCLMLWEASKLSSLLFSSTPSNIRYMDGLDRIINDLSILEFKYENEGDIDSNVRSCPLFSTPMASILLWAAVEHGRPHVREVGMAHGVLDLAISSMFDAFRMMEKILEKSSCSHFTFVGGMTHAYAIKELIEDPGLLLRLFHCLGTRFSLDTYTVSPTLLTRAENKDVSMTEVVDWVKRVNQT